MHRYFTLWLVFIFIIFSCKTFGDHERVLLDSQGSHDSVSSLVVNDDAPVFDVDVDEQLDLLDNSGDGVDLIDSDDVSIGLPDVIDDGQYSVLCPLTFDGRLAFSYNYQWRYHFLHTCFYHGSIVCPARDYVLFSQQVGYYSVDKSFTICSWVIT